MAVVCLLDACFVEVCRLRGDAAFACEVYMPGERHGMRVRPTEPYAAIFLRRRRQRGRGAALRAGGALGLWRRHADGDDDEPAHRMALQGLDNKPAQLINPTSE